MLAVAAVVVVIEQRPARADGLKIPVAELRSQAFELTLLDARLARGLSPIFGRAHARMVLSTGARSPPVFRRGPREAH